MANRKELGATPTAALAQWCAQISQNASIDSATRDEALNLAAEWVRLQMPCYPDLIAQRKIELAALKSAWLVSSVDVLAGPKTVNHERINSTRNNVLLVVL